MRVCFAACLPGTAKLNFNSENGVQPSIRMETEPRIAYFIIVIIIYIYIYTVSNIEEGERNKNYREKLFFLGAFLAEEREKKEKEKKREEGENRTSRTKLASFRNAEGGELGGLV